MVENGINEVNSRSPLMKSCMGASHYVLKMIMNVERAAAAAGITKSFDLTAATEKSNYSSLFSVVPSCC